MHSQHNKEVPKPRKPTAFRAESESFHNKSCDPDIIHFGRQRCGLPALHPVAEARRQLGLEHPARRVPQQVVDAPPLLMLHQP